MESTWKQILLSYSAWVDLFDAVYIFCFDRLFVC